jgi:hypothetical protein
MSSLGAKQGEPEAGSETVGELLLKKFDLALAPKESRENNERDQPMP